MGREVRLKLPELTEYLVTIRCGGGAAAYSIVVGRTMYCSFSREGLSEGQIVLTLS